MVFITPPKQIDSISGELFSLYRFKIAAKIHIGETSIIVVVDTQMLKIDALKLLSQHPKPENFAEMFLSFCFAKLCFVCAICFFLYKSMMVQIHLQNKLHQQHYSCPYRCGCFWLCVRFLIGFTGNTHIFPVIIIASFHTATCNFQVYA